MYRYLLRKIRLFLCCLAFFGINSTYAEQFGAQIEAQNLEIDQEKQQAVFYGNVFAKQKDFQIFADKLILYAQEESNKESIKTMPGDFVPEPLDQGPFLKNKKIKKIEAEGHVIFKKDKQIIKGDYAHFDQKKNLIYITGNKVTLQEGDNKAQGHLFIYDRNNGKITLKSSQKNENVRVWIAPS